MSELMTVSQVAKILKVNEVTVTRRFAKLKGVIDLGTPESPKRRRYRVLRIPKTVVEAYLAAKGSRLTVEVPTITKASRRADWKNKAAQDLIELTEQEGDEAEHTIEKIAELAQAMTTVPKRLWDKVYLMEDEHRTYSTISDECEAGECDKCPEIILDSGLVALEVACVHSCHRK
jgi:antitoxin component of MazEF toxin-antitoxin module